MFKAYNLMVKCTAHNGFYKGSNPFRPKKSIIMVI